MAEHREWDCLFLKMDLVSYKDGEHTGLKCYECGITFETWVSDRIRLILKRV